MHTAGNMTLDKRTKPATVQRMRVVRCHKRSHKLRFGRSKFQNSAKARSFRRNAHKVVCHLTYSRPTSIMYEAF